MKLEDFEKELKEINKGLSICPNNANQKLLERYPNVNKLASILYLGEQVCTIPNYDIYDEPNANYNVDLRGDGQTVKHRTRPEALQIVRDTLSRIESNNEFADQFFGRGEYTDAALMGKDTPVLELVDEVTAEVKEVGSGLLEGVK